MVKIYQLKVNLLKRSISKLGLLIVLSAVFSSYVSVASAANIPVPLAAGAYMVLENMDGFPANDQLVFSRIQIPWRRTDPVTPYNENHDLVTLRIHSKGYGDLNINNLALSNSSAWTIVSVGGNASPTYPITVTPRNFVDVVIKFIALDAATRVTVLEGSLNISSDDAITPNKEVKLRGLFQLKGEGRNEPYFQEIVNAFHFTTNVGYGEDDGNEGTTTVPGSDEIAASYFTRADVSKPVIVRQLAAYHSCCASTEIFRYFEKGTTSYSSVFTHNALDGQSLIPRLNNSLKYGQFTPNGFEVFGFRAGNWTSDRTLQTPNANPDQKIALRFEKVKDSNGNIIPNAYLVGMDYIAAEFTNYDYQDNVYYVENIKPETGSVNYSELVSASGSAVNFNATESGATTTFTVTLKNNGQSGDPSINITGAQIVGANASEFSVAPLVTTVPTQGTTPLDVNFNPNSTGIKNAVLLVSYNNSKSPLRIPLYGNAYDNSFIVEAVKRIKGGSDSPMIIGGETFEADQSYRTGSARLDAQVTPSDVAGTDNDELYQTYLSALTDLAATGYDIPLTNGSYMVRMHFVENFFPSQGSRVFNGTMEGQQIITNLDIFNEVGYRTAVVKDFNATVTDGVLNINFTPSVNRLAIGGLEIFKLSNNPLPVTLIDFTANKEGQTALLSWTTAAETNSKHFEIERSQNGKSWNMLGLVDAQGESVQDYHYSYVDNEPVNGENLYRLKMVDFDNTFTYSKLTNLNFTLQNDATIYPNPFAEKLILKVDDWNKIAQVRLYNVTGKVVYESQSNPVSGIDVRNLASGMYVVHVSRTDGSVLTYKVVKN